MRFSNDLFFIFILYIKMNYIIPIFLIIIVIIFDYFKINISRTEFFNNNSESIESDISDLYVITLGKEERMLNIKNQQSKIKKKINIFDAVNGLKLNIDELKQKNILSDKNNLSKNENHAKRQIGCYLSHLNIFKKIKKDNKKGYTIIFEDDFLINTDNLLEDVKKAIKTLNSKNINIDFLFLGNTKNNYGTNIVDNLYNIDNNNVLYGTYGYLINNANIDKIIDKTNQINNPIDEIIQNLSYNKTFDTIIVHPHLINHVDSYKSTVNNTESTN
jgi:GR25 family glycosyltransferase involved in LPS biosynthesis